MSHFLLDLQEAHQRTVVDLASNGLLRSLGDIDSNSVEFEPVLGSLCATIDPAVWDAQDVDADIVDIPAEDELPTEDIYMGGFSPRSDRG